MRTERPPGALGEASGIETDPGLLGATSRSARWRFAVQLRRVAMGAVAGGVRSLSRLPTRVLRLRGEAAGADHDLSLLYVGGGEDLGFIRKLAFASCTESVLDRRPTPLGLRSLLSTHGEGADVVVVDTALPAERWLVPPHFLHVPRWVKQGLNVDGTAADVRERVGSSTLKWARRMIRRHDYRVDLAVSDDARIAFFHDLYAPYVRERFGEDGVVVDEQRFRREARRAAVLRLWAGAEIVAGTLVRPAADELQIVWFGARTDAAARGFKGLSDVLDYAALDLAWRGGFTRLHFGASRPSLADGLLLYKQKWGVTIREGRVPRSDLRVWFDPESSAAQTLLATARLLVRTPSGLRELQPSGAAEADAPRPS